MSVGQSAVAEENENQKARELPLARFHAGDERARNIVVQVFTDIYDESIMCCGGIGGRACAK
ncbi:hypothetical protein A9W96_27680 [Mycobacterium sp. 1245852.3]|nr:hypothetical protein A9W96_27680 [Mycobacterium sp. 1245852.3]